MTIAIIDDELYNRLVLKNIIAEKCKDKQVIIEDGNIDSSIRKINELKPDIVLLDIELKNGTSFDILKALTYKPQIIFTTAHEKYAIAAIKVQAADYILKPIDEHELYSALVRCKNKIEKERENEQQIDATQHLFYSYALSNGKKNISCNEILYFESSGAYTYIKTLNDSIIISKNIGEVEKEISDKLFYRTHNSYIVNISKIKSVDVKRSGEITLLNDDIIPLSQRKLKEFLKLLKDKNQ